MEKTVTVEESTKRLRGITAELEGGAFTNVELYEKCKYIAYQAELAATTQADELIKAWRELYESTSNQYRLMNAGLVSQ